LCCLNVPLGVHDQRSRFRTYLSWIGFGCVILGPFLAIIWMTNPYTWGIPPQWLPEEWRICFQSCSSPLM
jgi:hypothetical protein